MLFLFCLLFFFFLLFLESIFDVIDQKFMFWWLHVRHPNLHGMLGNHQDHPVAFLSKQLVANGRALLNFWILSWTVYVRIMYVHSSLLIDFQIGGPCACNIHSSWSPSEFRMHLSMPIAKFSHSVHNLSFVLYMHLLQISLDRLTFTCILQLSENLLSDVHYPGAESVWVLPFFVSATVFRSTLFILSALNTSNKHQRGLVSPNKLQFGFVPYLCALNSLSLDACW